MSRSRRCVVRLFISLCGLAFSSGDTTPCSPWGARALRLFGTGTLSDVTTYAGTVVSQSSCPACSHHLTPGERWPPCTPSMSAALKPISEGGAVCVPIAVLRGVSCVFQWTIIGHIDHCSIDGGRRSVAGWSQLVNVPCRCCHALICRVAGLCRVLPTFEGFLVASLRQWRVGDARLIPR